MTLGEYLGYPSADVDHVEKEGNHALSMSHGVVAQLFGKSLAEWRLLLASGVHIFRLAASYYCVAALKANHSIVGEMSTREKSIRG